MNQLKNLVQRLAKIPENPRELIISTLAVLLVIMLIAVYPLWENQAGYWSLGQFVATVLLIPVMILGFDFQRREFVKSLAHSALDLSFSNAQGEPVKELGAQGNPTEGLVSFRAEIQIGNSGNAAAQLYRIELRGLRALCLGSGGCSEWFEALGGRSEDWKDDIQNKDTLIFNGMKNDHLIFPRRSSPLCELNVNLPTEVCQPRYNIDYTIYTQSEEPRVGALSITLHLPNPPGVQERAG